MKKRRIYYPKKTSHFEPPREKPEKQKDHDSIEPEIEEKESENPYSTRVQEPEKSEPQELIP